MANIMQKFLWRAPFTVFGSPSVSRFMLAPMRQFHSMNSLKAFPRSNPLMLSPLSRSFFTVMQNNRYLQSSFQTTNQALVQIPSMGFSIKTRHLKEKRLAARGKYKLKTKKAFSKRVRIVSQMFKFSSIKYTSYRNQFLNRMCIVRNLERQEVQVLQARLQTFAEKQIHKQFEEQKERPFPQMQGRHQTCKETKPLLQKKKIHKVLNFA